MNATLYKVFYLANRLFLDCCKSLLLGVLGLVSTIEAQDKKGEEYFEKHIRPILHEECIKCHGDEKQKGGLALHHKALAMAGGDLGVAIVPGAPEKSLLMEAIERKDEDLAMPPKKVLKKEQVQLFRNWIKMGAPWPEERHAKTLLPAAKRIDEVRETHWAFKPVADKGFSHAKQIDDLLKKQLQAQGLKFSALAKPEVLIRRAYLDLLGFPPTIDEVQAFVDKPSIEAYKEIIDELLSRPEYGERWGRHWLDVARYGDTKGAKTPSENINYPYAYTYRDYVIDAFNKDMPYDQFIKEQLAIDLMGDHKEKKSKSLAALGFVNVGPNFLSVHDRISDKVDVVTRGFLGMTVSCARCHDHKTDPVTIKDYYALYGVFNNTYKPKVTDMPIIGQVKNEKHRKEFERKLDEIQNRYDKFYREKLDKANRELREDVAYYLHYYLKTKSVHKVKGVVKRVGKTTPLWDHAIKRWEDVLKKLKPSHRVLGPMAQVMATKNVQGVLQSFKEKQQHYNPSLVKALSQAIDAKAVHHHLSLADFFGRFLTDDQQWGVKDSPAYKEIEKLASQLPLSVPKPHVMKYFTQGERTKLNRIENSKIDLAIESSGAPHRAMVLYDKDKLHGQQVFTRGDPARRSDPVKRRFLEVLFPFVGGQDFGVKNSGRLALAEAIVHKENPLTAKVMANRIWNWHFGQSLVESPSDYGMMTPEPLQRELLDGLAKTFMDSGWSIKHMHRLLMMSHAYRQSSDFHAKAYAVDPDNTRYWRFKRQRMTLEQMRDSMLSVTDSLDLEMGGKPYQIGEYVPRRTIYAKVDRNMIPDVYVNFDAGNLSSSLATRPVSSVPQQALYLMNDKFVMNQASRLAKHPTLKNLEGQQWVRGLFHLVYAREPSEQEVSRGFSFLKLKELDAPLVKKLNWEYGYGKFDPQTRHVESFQKFVHFTGKAWRMGKEYPHPKYRYADLFADGGHAGKNEYSVVRRWTSPLEGELDIASLLIHTRECGDGVYAYIHSSEHGLLKEGHAFKNTAEVNTKLKVKAGELIDFVIHCGKSTSCDSFKWDPNLKLSTSSGDHVWQASEQFSGPSKEQKLLNQKEALAQILLMSNEFHFID